MLTPIEVAPSHTPEWHEAHYSLIGSSEAAGACGVADYTQPLEIYLRKRKEAEPFTGNRKTRRGTHNEPFILKEFCDEFGVSVERYPMPLFRHPDHPFIGATPDAQLSRREGLEIKDIGWRQRSKFGEQDTDCIPVEYVMQAQQQMLVMQWDVVTFAVMCDDDLKRYRVERNDKLIAGMIEAEAELWERIQSGNPPEPEWSHPRTPALIKAMRKSVGKGYIAATDEMAALWEEIESLGRIEKDAKEARELKRAKFLHLLGDRFAAVLPGGTKMVRQAFIEKKSYTVAASKSLDMRVVNYDGGEIEDAPEFPAEIASEIDTTDRFIEVDALLKEAGFVHYETSDSGSRYYVTDDGGERVRVADHGPNKATAAWMERRNVREIRIDAPEFDARRAVDIAVTGIYA